VSNIPSSVVAGARGRAGAAYYASAANIIADSAARESQIIASQSALALGAMENLGQSMSAGLTKYLDYKLALKQQTFERDMKTREFQIRESEMEIMRLQAEDMHLAKEQERQTRDLDIAQKWQTIQSEPKVRAARMAAAGLLSNMQSAAANIETENYTDADLIAVTDGYKALGNIAKDLAAAGAPQAEIEQLRNQTVELAKKAGTVKFLNGDVISRAAARRNSLLLNTASGQRLFIERPRNGGLADPVGDENYAWASTVIRDTKYTSARTADSALKMFLEAQGIPNDSKDPRYLRAQTLINSVRMMDPESQAKLRVTAMTQDDPDRQAQIAQYTAANPGASAISVESKFFPKVDATGAVSPIGWKPPVTVNLDDKFIRKTLRGEREITVEAMISASRDGFSLADLSVDDAARLTAGDYSTFDKSSLDQAAPWLTGAAGGTAVVGGGTAAVASGVGATGAGAAIAGGAVGAAGGLGAATFGMTKRVGGLIYGNVRSGWRQPSKDVEQAYASENLSEIVAWAAAAPTPAVAAERLERAELFADGYKKAYKDAHGVEPNSFALSLGLEGALSKMRSQFSALGFSSGNSRLDSLLLKVTPAGSSMRSYPPQTIPVAPLVNPPPVSSPPIVAAKER